MEELIRTFDAYDNTGKKYTLRKYQTVIPAGNRDDPHGTARGATNIRTQDGLHVNVLEEGRLYEIAQTGVKLTER